MRRPGELALGPVRVTSGFLVGSALWLLTEDGPGLTALFFLAGLAHELGHALTALALGLPVRGLRLGLMGAELYIPCAPGVPYWRELAVLAAGPLVNFALAGLLAPLRPAWCGLLSGANLLLALFNLLPIPPLDGGALLRLCADWVCPTRQAYRLTGAVSGAACGLLLGVGGWFALRGNLSLLLLSLWLAAGLLREGGKCDCQPFRPML